MRLLFSFVGGQGHLAPLVPIARAAAARGHEVAFACAPAMERPVRAAGFEAFAFAQPGPPAPESAPSKRTALLEPDPAREERDLRERFVRRAARDRAPRVRALCADWRPDAVACDETDFGAMLGAELCGLPWASVQVIAAGSFVRPDVVGEALGELRAELGLAQDPALRMLHRHLVLSPFPPSFRDPAFPAPDTAVAISPSAGPRTEPAPALDVPLARPGAPIVYLTLGTVFNMESGDLFERLLAGLAALPVNVLATVGPRLDPGELGSWPDHVRLVDYRPQQDILPHCALVVSHGGSGSVMGALAHGLPSVLAPLGADQPANAGRCVALGCGRVLDPVRVTPGEVTAAAGDALGDAGLQAGAARLRDEIASLPPASHGVERLERLPAGRA